MSSFGGRATRREFLRDSAILGAAATLGSPLLAACSSGGGAASSSKPQRSNTLFIGGFQWGPATNLNPLGSNSAWPNQAQNGYLYIYETLFGFDLLSGDIKPVLAKSISYPDQTTAVVKLQDGTHWQDGKPLTADDVLYTFNLGKDHKEIIYSTFWTYVSSVTKTDDKTIQFTLNKDQLNPLQLRHYLAFTHILPQHIWTDVEKKGGSLLSYVDLKPVGSGPFKVYDVNQQRVALVRDDNYWGKSALGAPAPAFMIHPIFKSNDDANLAFQNAELDVSQTFAPQIWQMWEKKNLPVGTWLKQPPYHIPGQLPMIHLNLSKPGLNRLEVRKALAYAIDYAQIAETAMSRYSIPVNASLILPDGAEKKFFPEAAVQSSGWTHNPQKAVQLLESIGATKGSDGIYKLSDGTRLGPWKAQCPYGWTDWMTSLQVVSSSAKAAGIDITANFPEAPVHIAATQNGDFDIAMYTPPATGSDPAAPWARFRDILDSRGVPPRGQTAFWNYARFSDPSVPGLLDQAAAASPADQPKLYAQLDEVWRKNIPTIPLEYRPLQFYEYHEKVWSGFPNSGNAYAPPTFIGAGVKWLSKIKVKSS
jgi:peptide/nickel transport system substrate-binding protein